MVRDGEGSDSEDLMVQMFRKRQEQSEKEKSKFWVVA